MENREHRREPEANSSNEFHKICKVFIVLEGATLQLMHQPFETHYGGMVAFIVVVLIYFSSLSAEYVLQTNGIRHVIVSKLSLFLGVLTVITPILITVPAIGGLALAMWVSVSLIVVCRSHVEIRRDFVDTYEDLLNRLRNGNANEQQPNGVLDEIDGNANEQQPNGVLDEIDGNANEQQQPNAMLDEIDGNANEQQPNRILDEIDGNANQQQPNAMLDENQHEDPELPV